ncbi:MAG: cation:proton antiporter [Alphaproteobacteria bacterium]
MLFSLALIFISGLVLGQMFVKLKLPSLLGMIIAGVIIGPQFLNLLSSNLLNISIDLRQIALIIILTRAGLNLNIDDLKKVGRPAILMCFVPACFEIVGVILLAPKILGISILEAGVLGTVLAAVSPAVIVPRMLKIMNEGYGKEKSVPQMIMAGGAVDDIFVIVLFAAFVSLAQGGAVDMKSFLSVPSAIMLGLVVGIIFGMILLLLFNKTNFNNSQKTLILLAVSFVLVTIEHSNCLKIGFSGLLAVMALGATIAKKNCNVASKLSEKFAKLWVGAEILLFVLVGASVDVSYATKSGASPIVLILGVLIFRMLGVFVCLIKTKLNKKERLFSAIAYLPKATVQAAIGGLPLAMGLACGDVVLTIAVLSILITAPLGAKLIDISYKKLL